MCRKSCVLQGNRLYGAPAPAYINCVRLGLGWMLSEFGSGSISTVLDSDRVRAETCSPSHTVVCAFSRVESWVKLYVPVEQFGLQTAANGRYNRADNNDPLKETEMVLLSQKETNHLGGEPEMPNQCSRHSWSVESKAALGSLILMLSTIFSICRQQQVYNYFDQLGEDFWWVSAWRHV